MATHNELISIIIPVYNVENYLTDCLNCLVDQTYHNFEAILVNDGSTDNSLRICKEYVAKDSRFILIEHKSNQGLSATRNTALKQVNGEWFVFLDADDFMSPYFLETMINQVTDDVDMVIAKTKFISEKLLYRFSDWDKPVNPEVVTYSSAEFLPLYCSLQIRAVTVWNKLLRTEVHRDITFPVDYYYEDIITSYKYVLSSRKIAFIKSELYGYRKRRGSITSNYSNPKNRSDLIAIICRMREEIKNLDPNKKALLSAFMFHNLASWYRNFVPLGFNRNKDITTLLKELNKEAINNRIEISIYRLRPSLFHFNVKMWHAVRSIYIRANNKLRKEDPGIRKW